MTSCIPSQYCCWWRIVDTGTWVNDGLDILGPALISLTGHGDRLKTPDRGSGMHEMDNLDTSVPRLDHTLA